VFWGKSTDIPKEVFKEMPEITITENGVEKLLQNLNPNKACGPDELTPRLLKEFAHERLFDSFYPC
jgi:hypothetical protein